MCLILFAINEHPVYELVIAANRDEFYERPTLPAHVWSDPGWMVAGKDLEGGGTWLGISPFGKLAMLTNFRDPSRILPNAPSRGALITDFLASDKSSQDYLEGLRQAKNTYNGYNLLCEDRSGMHYYSNYGEKVQQVEKGIHGLSNALLNDPWPKVRKGKDALRKWIEQQQGPTELFQVLYDTEKAEIAELPETGVGMEWERELSPMFIKTPQYGSRTSTIILRDRRGRVTFLERTYNRGNDVSENRHFNFRIKHRRSLER